MTDTERRTALAELIAILRALVADDEHAHGRRRTLLTHEADN